MARNNKRKMFKKLKNFIKNKKGSYVQLILLMPILLFLLVLIGTEVDYVSTRTTAEKDAKTALRYIVREKNGNAAAANLVSILKTLGEEKGIDYIGSVGENKYQAFIYVMTTRKEGDIFFYEVYKKVPMGQWNNYYTDNNGDTIFYWKRGNIVELTLHNVTSGIFNDTANICFMGSDNCINLFQRDSEVVVRMSIEYAEVESMSGSEGD